MYLIIFRMLICNDIKFLVQLICDITTSFGLGLFQDRQVIGA